MIYRRMLCISEDYSERDADNDTECNWFEWNAEIVLYITVKLDMFLCTFFNNLYVHCRNVSSNCFQCWISLELTLESSWTFHMIKS